MTFDGRESKGPEEDRPGDAAVLRDYRPLSSSMLAARDLDTMQERLDRLEEKLAQDIRQEQINREAQIANAVQEAFAAASIRFSQQSSQAESRHVQASDEAELGEATAARPTRRRSSYKEQFDEFARVNGRHASLEDRTDFVENMLSSVTDFATECEEGQRKLEERMGKLERKLEGDIYELLEIVGGVMSRVGKMQDHLQELPRTPRLAGASPVSVSIATPPHPPPNIKVTPAGKETAELIPDTLSSTPHKGRLEVASPSFDDTVSNAGSYRSASSRGGIRGPPPRKPMDTDPSPHFDGSPLASVAKAKVVDTPPTGVVAGADEMTAEAQANVNKLRIAMPGSISQECGLANFYEKEIATTQNTPRTATTQNTPRTATATPLTSLLSSSMNSGINENQASFFASIRSSVDYLADIFNETAGKYEFLQEDLNLEKKERQEHVQVIQERLSKLEQSLKDMDLGISNPGNIVVKPIHHVLAKEMLAKEKEEWEFHLDSLQKLLMRKAGWCRAC